MLGLYLGGQLKLDELITRRYSIDEAGGRPSPTRVGQERARRDRVPAMTGRILVVDDQRAIAEMMAGVLQGAATRCLPPSTARRRCARCAPSGPIWWCRTS